MSVVRVFTAERMQAIEDEAITGARLDGTDLILIRNNNTEINLGNVKGATGSPGVDELIWKAGSTLAGSSPTGGGDAQPLKVQAGKAYVTTNTSGDATVTFPQAFSGVAAVVMQMIGTVDVSYTHLNGANYPDAPLGVGNINLTLHSYTTTTFKLRAFAGGGSNAVYGNPIQDIAVGGISFDVAWIAYGW